VSRKSPLPTFVTDTVGDTWRVESATTIRLVQVANGGPTHMAPCPRRWVEEQWGPLRTVTSRAQREALALLPTGPGEDQQT
jgi:hypothetical protein